jgi:hypothetical protein
MQGYLGGPMATDTLTSDSESAQELPSEAYAPASPFAESFDVSPDLRGGGQESGYESYAAAPGLESPFRSVAVGTSGEAQGGPERAEFENLVANLALRIDAAELRTSLASVREPLRRSVEQSEERR